MGTLEQLFNGNGRIGELDNSDFRVLVELVMESAETRGMKIEFTDAKDRSTVLIDGAVPRTFMERCVHLYTEMICLDDYVVTDRTEALDPGHKWQQVFGDLPRGDSEAEDDSLWSELEDEIIDEINAHLPDEWVCTLGEVCPGDVIIREATNDDDE